MWLLDFFFDASFAADSVNRKFTKVSLLLYISSSTSWLSKKQSIVAIFTTEAEYITLTATAETEYALHRTLSHMKILFGGPLFFKTENQAARDMVSQSFVTKCRTFIYLRHHYIQDQIASHQLAVMHVPGTEQKSDVMTKALRRVLFTDKWHAIGRHG